MSTEHLFSSVLLPLLQQWRLRLQAFRGGRTPALACVRRCLPWSSCVRSGRAYLHDGSSSLFGRRLAQRVFAWGLAFAALDRRIALTILAIILLLWVPDISSMYRAPSPWRPFREIAHAAFVNASPSDVILVREVRADVLGIARYASGPAPLASSLERCKRALCLTQYTAWSLARTRVIFVWNVLEPAPEEKWLRANGVRLSRHPYGLVQDSRLFDAISSKTF